MKKLLMIVGAGLLMSVQVFAQKATVFNTDGTAIHGYDAVAFFTDSKPEKGKAQFSYKWQDINWLFASNKNLEAGNIPFLHTGTNNERAIKIYELLGYTTRRIIDFTRIKRME